MRPLEILLILTLLVRPWLTGRLHRALDYLPAAAALLQLLLEGYRWQMLPLYILAGIYSVIAAFRTPKPNTGRRLFLAGSAGTLLTLLAAALPVALPIPRPFAPTGPHPIGTRTLHLVDETRTDPYAPDPTAPRELLVQLWYPTKKAGRSWTTSSTPEQTHTRTCRRQPRTAADR